MMYDIIVFLNSVFVRPHSNEKPVLPKIFTLGTLKPAFWGPENAVYVWTEGYKTEKKSPFSKISGYLWMGSEPVFFFFSDVPFVKWMTFLLNMSHVFLVTRE